MNYRMKYLSIVLPKDLIIYRYKPFIEDAIKERLLNKKSIKFSEVDVSLLVFK